MRRCRMEQGRRLSPLGSGLALLERVEQAMLRGRAWPFPFSDTSGDPSAPSTVGPPRSRAKRIPESSYAPPPARN